MADYDQRAQRATWPRATTVDTGAIDQGLRAYMLQVYNYMGFALALTGAVAWFTYRTPALFQAVTQTPLAYVVMFAPLGIVFYLSFRVHKLSVAAAQTWFWAFAALFGLSLSFIFAVYTQTSIARVFFITAGMFGGMSLYGYTTRTDLSRFGSFLIMGVIGIIIAMLVNLFLHSSALDFAVSVIGVLLFTGLTAYDTQRIKEMYFEGDGALVAGRKAIMGALALYLDFLNMFLFMLRLFGGQRS
jgi:FtsH-binding integral membrane protein